jgi:hypothetical protein
MSEVHELEKPLSLAQYARKLNPAAARGDEGEEASRRCFGFLRGTRERAIAIEFRRHASGDSFALPYAWLGPHYFHPSHGIVLVFAGPLSYVVTLTGRHLNTVEKDVSLYERGILRQRVTWIAETKPGRGAAHAADGAGDPRAVDQCVVEGIELAFARTEEELIVLLEPVHQLLSTAKAGTG